MTCPACPLPARRATLQQLMQHVLPAPCPTTRPSMQPGPAEAQAAADPMRRTTDNKGGCRGGHWSAARRAGSVGRLACVRGTPAAVRCAAGHCRTAGHPMVMRHTSISRVLPSHPAICSWVRRWHRRSRRRLGRHHRGDDRRAGRRRWHGRRAPRALSSSSAWRRADPEAVNVTRPVLPEALAGDSGMPRVAKCACKPPPVLVGGRAAPRHACVSYMMIHRTCVATVARNGVREAGKEEIDRDGSGGSASAHSRHSQSGGIKYRAQCSRTLRRGIGMELVGL